VLGGGRIGYNWRVQNTAPVLDVVVPINPPPDWVALSPTGQVPAMQDGDFTLSESSANCLYLERKQKEPSILPIADEANARAVASTKGMAHGWCGEPSSLGV
jgi:glutathione S-transferase